MPPAAGQFATPRGALARLRRRLPLGAAHVLDWIRRADGTAYLVGGAVRDAFMSRPILDWDIATDLVPDRVAALFPRVVLAGLKHGTVMVLTPTGPVEVTTFRGEGPYLDGRRPSRVFFHEDLHADLARRDFTINAMAADLGAGAIIDPFAGERDLRARRIRCVGDARARFAEDGLRPLRALRFAATLDFSLHRDTRDALGSDLPTFEEVALERKRDEMEKLLAGLRLRPAIRLLVQSGILERLAPGLDRAPPGIVGRLETLPNDAYLRLAAWAVGAGMNARRARALVAGWKTSRREQARVAAAVAAVGALPRAPSARGLRRWVSVCGRQGTRDAARVAAALWPRQHGAVPGRLARMLRQKPPLTLADLAVDGDDLSALGLRGRAIGSTLAALLAAVLDRPSCNRREVLLTMARELSTG